MIRSLSLKAALLLAVTIGGPIAATAAPCTQEAMKTIVEDTGRSLRKLQEETQPRIDAGFRKLKAKRGWSDSDYLEKATELLADEKIDAFESKASELLARLDRLSVTQPGEQPDCSRIADLEVTALELQAAIRAKLRYMVERLDALTADAPPAPVAGEPPPARSADATPIAPKTPPASPPAPPKAKAQEKTPPEKPAPKTAAAPPAKSTLPPSTASSGWESKTHETKPAPSKAPASAEVAAVTPPPSPVPPGSHAPAEPGATAPPVVQPSDETFSIDEIREASRGFFGTFSKELASVIEHAFANSGRPTGYILGNEGGGAFIAGLRYGKGTLFTRGREAREIFWHGPSIGYDFGASGSKALFLVYRLQDPLDIYSGFTGIDGSAYLVGGVGMTLLTDGRVILAPIRTGIGLRLGASIGYIRFTPKATWSPL